MVLCAAVCDHLHMAVTVLIVDDHPAFRASARTMLELDGFEVPVEVPGVESSLLDPRSTWRDPEAYDRRAAELAAMFRENFEKKFADTAGPDVAAAGPR